MSFANPMFLWAIGLAAIPLWLHLSRRRKFRKLETGTLRFLEEAHRSRRRKARWEEILLMLLRIGATILLALLFARPMLSAKSPEPDPAAHTLVLLDASGSITPEMAAEAKRQANKASRKTGENESLTFAQFSDQIQTISSLEEYRPQPGAPSRFDLAVDWALDRFLENDTADSAQLILIGHFAHSALPENPPRVWPDGIDVEMIPLTPEKTINSAVTSIDLRTPYRKDHMEVEARLHLSREAATSVSIEVEGYVEEKEVLPGTERALFQFRPSRDRVRGWVRVKSENDPWPADDARPFVFQWTDRNRVLLIDGDPGGTPFNGEAYFIKKALEASGAEHGLSPFEPEIAYGLQNRTGMLPLADYDAVILCGVEEISAGESREIKSYVENGGGLFIVPGTGWAPALYASLIADGFFPSAVGEDIGESKQRIESWDPSHPALASFAKTGSGDLRSLPWIDGYEISLAEDDDQWKSIAQLESGRSVLVASNSLRVLICPHPLNRDWTDLPRDPVFVPFVKNLVAYLVDAQEPPEAARNLVPGIEETREAGWYLFPEPRPPEIVATDPAESDISTADINEAAAAIGLPSQQSGERAQENELEKEKASAAKPFGPRPRELWPWFALLLLVCFVIEGIVATAPKRGDPQTAGIILAAFALISLTNPLHAQGPNRVSALRTELRTALMKFWVPQAKISSQYAEAVHQLRSQVISKNDPDSIEVIDQELATFQKIDDRQYPQLPKLQMLRDFYVKSRTEIDADQQRARQTLLEIYKDRYQELEASLSGSGRIEEAVAAQREITKLEAAIEDQAKVEKLMPFWSLEKPSDVLLERDTEINRKGGGFVITSEARANGNIRSTESFNAPYQIRMRIATESTNIRIYIGRRLLTIFNWEGRPTELRVHDPTPGTNRKFTARDKGFLEVDEMHDIRIRVGRDQIMIMADGEMRYLLEGDFSKLTGDVGVGPAFGSVLTIEQFDVMPLLEL